MEDVGIKINELDCKIQGAEHVLNILVQRGTIKFKESTLILEPFYREMEVLMKINLEDNLKQK